jgi:hypothetical protein
VTHDHVRGDAVGGEHPGHRDVRGEHRRLGDLGLQQLLLELRDGGGVGGVDEDVRRQRPAQDRGHHRSASANVAATIGSMWRSSSIMLTYCEPWPV